MHLKKIISPFQRFLRQETSIANNSNFLELGGDSFKAIQMTTAMEMWCRQPLTDFVDILLHKSYLDVVSYVEGVVSGRTEISMEDGGRRGSVEENGRILKRKFANLKHTIPSVKHIQSSAEHIQESDNVTKCPDDVNLVFSSNTCPQCTLTVSDNSSICSQHRCLTSIATNQNTEFLQPGYSASSPVPQNATNNTNVTSSHNPMENCNPSISRLPHNALLDSPLPCTHWQYSVRRGSQMNISNRQPEGQFSCCCTDDNVTEDNNGKDSVISIKEMWKYNTGKCVDASPLIVRGR